MCEGCWHPPAGHSPKKASVCGDEVVPGAACPSLAVPKGPHHLFNRQPPCGPQEQWFWEGHGHCVILGGFDSSADTSNSARAPCHDHSTQLSPGPLPQEHRAAPTQQAYSKEDTLPTATFLLLEVTRYKEPDLHATCHWLGLLCPSVCHAGREEGGWQRQAPPDWCPHYSQGFPCSLCDRHHFCCDGFALPAMSKHYGRGKSPMGQELGPLS